MYVHNVLTVGKPNEIKWLQSLLCQYSEDTDNGHGQFSEDKDSIQWLESTPGFWTSPIRTSTFTMAENKGPSDTYGSSIQWDIKDAYDTSTNYAVAAYAFANDMMPSEYEVPSDRKKDYEDLHMEYQQAYLDYMARKKPSSSYKPSLPSIQEYQDHG